MKKILSAFLALMILLAAFACAEESQNLVRNGDFSQIDTAGMPVHWEKDMWFTDKGVSSLYVAEDGVDGNCAAIVNFSENDARFRQTIAVEPDSYYRFSCLARAENCGTEGYGATLSIEDTFTYSNEVLDTGGQWQELVLYGRTGEDQTELNLLIRIGGYSMINSGSACFDNVQAVKVDSLPEGVEAQLLYRKSTAKAENTDTETVPKRNTEAYLLMAVLYGVMMLALARKNHRLSGIQSAKKLLWIGLGVAFVIRLLTAVLVRGYNTDINCFSAWSERIFSNGLANFYSDGYFCDYPPGYMLLLWPVALIRNLLGTVFQSRLHILLLKLFPILCDLLGALLIFRCAEKRRWNPALAAALALVYAFNPAAIIDSAAWGQIDSVFTLLIAICALQAADENYISSLIAFAAAMLIKPQALLFAPLGLFAIVANLIRSRDVRKLRSFGLGVLAALGTIYAVAFIFTIGRAESLIDALIQPVTWLTNLYGSTMSGYQYITVNALNLYTLFDLNWKSTASAPLWTIAAWILFGLSYAYSALLYVKSGSRRRLPLAGAVLITLIFTFGPMIHERYIFPAMLLLTLAFVYDRDRRLLISLTVMTAVAAMNEILVLQGGMTEANYGHLQSSEQWLNAVLSLINIANALYLSWIALDICILRHTIPLKTGVSPEEIVEPAFESDHRLHLRKKDYLLMAAVTLIYSIAAFTNLGTTAAPQTAWTSTQSGESVVFDLGETHDFTMIYYGGICDSAFTIETSPDSENWSEPADARYDQGEIFRWIFHSSSGKGNPIVMNGRYVRITSDSAGLELREFGFRSTETNQLLDARIARHDGFMEGFETDPRALVDEQNTVPEKPSYYNSSYFDEIYHARTAYELLHGEYAYEWTHPHLGKILMMVGIQLFGMSPFGWRFMGALVGVAMLPLMYLLAKQLTKSTKLSFAAMFLMAVDSMHFTQTRIATIDSYAVFWIMLMYLFMFRYAQMDWKKVSLGRTFIPLGLCGVTMGVAWATKWIGIYGSVGLAFIFFWKIISELMRAGELRKAFARRCIASIGFCLIFFVIIPLLIYYFSYYPQLRYEGVSTVWDMLSPRWIKRIVTLQEDILGYHAGLGGDTHYFRSPWYQWPIVWWPMWYYSGADFMPEGMVSSISCMGNPAVWWAGLAALIIVLVLCAWKRRASRNALLVLVGFASQFLPWVLVPRSTFIYHYFASVPFIILCTAMVLGWLKKRSAKAAVYATVVLLAAALVLFIAFYPLESGYPVAESYAKYLRWFKWYNY